jgi:hypothetical protein
VRVLLTPAVRDSLILLAASAYERVTAAIPELATPPAALLIPLQAPSLDAVVPPDTDPEVTFFKRTRLYKLNLLQFGSVVQAGLP